MELSRLRRMVRARWWIVVAMALLGVIAAIAFTNYNNENIEQRFRSVGSIYFVVAPAAEEETTGRGGGGGGLDADASALVDTALVAAQEENAALLEQSGVQIVAAQNEPRIDFVALQPSAEAAEAFVNDMRDNYIRVDPTAVDVEGEIDALIEESSKINERLAELTPPEPEPAKEISINDQAQIDVYQSEVDALNGRLGVLQDEKLDIDPEDTEALEAADAQIETIRDQIAVLKRRIANLTPDEPEVVEFELTAAESLEKAALEAQIASNSIRYQELLVLRETGGDSITVGEIETTDETPAATSAAVSGLIGLIGGAIAGFAAIVFMDRVQGTVWTRKDMEQMPILAEVPQSSGGMLRSKRYEAVRQKGVQSIRSAVLGLFHAGGPATIGFTGLGSSDEGVSSLVLDLARSLAGVGRSVLVVDGQIGGLAALRGQVSGGSTLAELSTHDTDESTLDASISSVLDRTLQLAPNLSVLPGDPRTADPVDVLASKSFRVLTEQASSRYDIVLVVGPSALSPFAYVMAGLVSAYVVVTTMGRTRQAHIEQLAKQFAGSPSRLVGAVLLGVKPRRGFVPASDLGGESVPGTASPAIGDEAVPPTTGVPAESPGGGLLDKLGESLASLAGDKKDE